MMSITVSKDNKVFPTHNLVNGHINTIGPGSEFYFRFLVRALKMFNYEFQHLARLCRDILKVEQGLEPRINMDTVRFRLVVIEAIKYIRKTHPCVRIYGVSLLYHVSASLLDCMIVSAMVRSDTEDIALQTLNRQSLESSVENYIIGDRDYSFFHGQTSSALPNWHGLPDLVKRLILDMCAIQYKMERSSLAEHHVTRSSRYMAADDMIDDVDCDIDLYHER